MSSVERNESGYIVTLTEEEAADIRRVWPPSYNWHTPYDCLVQAIADSLRACQPPPPSTVVEVTVRTADGRTVIYEVARAVGGEA